MGLTLENTFTPTTLRHLALNLDDLEPPEEAAADSRLWDMQQEQGVSSDACNVSHREVTQHLEVTQGGICRNEASGK